LIIQRETDDEEVGQVNRTDAGGIAHAGSAVDDDEIVLRSRPGHRRVEKLAALQFRIELMPVEQTESLGVRRSLPPRANEPQLGVVRKEIAIEHFDKRVQLGVPDEIVCRLIVEIRLSDCDRRQIDDKIQQAVGGDLRRVVEEGMKVAMKSWCFEIPVDEED